MKGDFTRSTFESAKHYSSVRMQQGRVQLDADWNEQLDIAAHRIATETVDVIGPTGAPQDGGGFEIGLTPDGSDLAISPGRIYVDGVLCELDPSAVPIIKMDTDSQKTVAIVTLEALTLDGRVLAKDEWVEILYPNGKAYPRKIAAVDVANSELTLAGGAAKPDPKARLRRLTTFATQYDLPGEKMPTKGSKGSYAVILDVWERHVTAHEDPEIREIALGGPDTATRTQVIAQVKLIEPKGFKGQVTCGNVPDWRAELPQRTGRLRARARPDETQNEPCLTPAGEGYRRLENQLYRVEVHRVRDLGGGKKDVTFKWSRDNGSVVTDWTGQNGNDLQVSSLGRDNVLGFRGTTWAELIDDTHELRGEPGTLVRVTQSGTADNTLTIDPLSVTPVGSTTTYSDFPRHPKLRRWDSDGEVTIEVPTGNEGYLPLEGGVEVRFDKDGVYQPGDYWLIPARTAVGDEGGDVLWPTDLSDPKQPLALLPHGVQHHYCLLAVWQDGNAPQDCRPEFPSLTELTTLLYESGDGQEARPGDSVPQPLCVRVVNGQRPVDGAQVKFTVEQGGGEFLPKQPPTRVTSTIITTHTITTHPVPTPLGEQGIAECGWELGDADTDSGYQRVRAELLDAAGKEIPGQVLHFNASLNLDTLLYVGGDGQEARPGHDLSYKLEVRVVNGQAPVDGARVQFQATGGGGKTTVDRPVTPPPPLPLHWGLTDSAGIAACTWTLGASGDQTVTVVLLNAQDRAIAGQVLHFNASLNLPTLLYVGGDGQEAMPNNPLPQSLRTRVIDEQGPVLGASVQFMVTLGGGSFAGAVKKVTVTTVSADAIAECAWTLGPLGPQQVQAVLLGSAGQPVPGQFLQFNANLSIASEVAYDPKDCDKLAGAATVKDAIDGLCKLVGGPQEPGIKIKTVEIGITDGVRQTLHNDTRYSPADLAGGILVTCDSAVFSASVSPHPGDTPNPVCFVTLDLPYPLTTQDYEFWKGFGSVDPPLGHTPLVLAGTATVVAPPTAAPPTPPPPTNCIEWSPLSGTQSWLKGLLFPAVKRVYDRDLPLLVHLTLKGNFIWGPNRDSDRYLDGEVFGAPGAGNTEIKLPSGNSQRGGDFEAWFWIPEVPHGLIVKSKIGQIATSANLKLALSMALDRSKLSQFMPAGFRVDASQPFDPVTARKLIKEVGLPGAALQVWAGKSVGDLAKPTVEMLTSNAGLKPQLTIVDDSNQDDLLTKILTSSAAGAGPDIIIGDGSIADALARQAPDLFDGSLVRF